MGAIIACATRRSGCDDFWTDVVRFLGKDRFDLKRRTGKVRQRIQCWLLLDFLLSCSSGIHALCATRLHNRNTVCLRNRLARTPAPGANSMLVHPGCTNSGLRALKATFPKGAGVPPSSRALSPVSDCSDFAITEYIRVLFAPCQVLCSL